MRSLIALIALIACVALANAGKWEEEKKEGIKNTSALIQKNIFFKISRKLTPQVSLYARALLWEQLPWVSFDARELWQLLHVQLPQAVPERWLPVLWLPVRWVQQLPQVPNGGGGRRQAGVSLPAAALNAASLASSLYALQCAEWRFKTRTCVANKFCHSY